MINNNKGEYKMKNTKELTQLERIDKLSKSIRRYCFINSYSSTDANGKVFERIGNATLTLALNALRMKLNKETTIELVGSNVTNDDIEDILIYINKELNELLFPHEIQNNIFNHLKKYNIYPYFLMRTNKQEYEIFGY